MLRLITLLLLLLSQLGFSQIARSPLFDQVNDTVWPRLSAELKSKDLKPGNPLFVRIFKQEGMLELWVLKNKHYTFFKSYPICTFSGGLGTKICEGDGKSPEGFYTITAKQLNPFSRYRLAINIGYPNAMERANNYTGNAIMIHGSCASIGCYAMTDAGIDEIYTMVYQALTAGQKAIELHIMPFKLNRDNLARLNSPSGNNLWTDMKKGYDIFERDRIPPLVSVIGKRYAFDPK